LSEHELFHRLLRQDAAKSDARGRVFGKFKPELEPDSSRLFTKEQYARVGFRQLPVERKQGSGKVLRMVGEIGSADGRNSDKRR
jgi:hypothetical protein